MKTQDKPTLKEWMAANQVIDEDVALAVGCTRPYITKVRNAAVHPNLGLALNIFDYTNGEIDIRSLLPLHLQPESRRPPQVKKRRAGTPRMPPEPKVSRSHARA